MDGKNQLHTDFSFPLFMISLGFLYMVYAVAIYYAVKDFNPDADAYWLIGTGRWIFEHRRVPSINPWTYEERLSIIVQQPLCALLNYLWFQYFGGLSNMWMLACLENVILLISIIFLAGKYSLSKTDAVLTAALTEVIFIIAGVITTRPYQLTTAAMALLIANLEESHRKRNVGRAVIAVVLVTLFQANYQMASLFMIPCLISCYFFGNVIGRIRNTWLCYRRVCTKLPCLTENLNEVLVYSRPIRETGCMEWLWVYLGWGLAGIMNPYGINGLLYLPKAKEAMASVGNRIYEMTAPKTTSFPFILALITIMLFCYLAMRRKRGTIPLAFLVTGSALASFLAIRNLWMSALSFAVLYPQIIGRKREGYAEIMDNSEVTGKHHLMIWMGCLFYAAGVISILYAGHNAVFVSKDMILPITDMMQEIQSLPEDERLYTSFNTGGVALFAGHKIYVDARPELYSPDITGNRDILKEWVEFEWKNTDEMPVRVNNSGWKYYLVSPDTPLCYYLEYSGKFELICQAGNMKLFSKKQNTVSDASR